MDGSVLKLYVDGMLQKQSAPCAGNIPSSTNDLFIGMNRPTGDPAASSPSLHGLLDELMIFDRALSEAEVKTVMASAKPRFTEAEVKRRKAELKELLERGLILREFHDRKLKELETQ